VFSDDAEDAEFISNIEDYLHDQQIQSIDHVDEHERAISRLHLPPSSLVTYDDDRSRYRHAPMSLISPSILPYPSSLTAASEAFALASSAPRSPDYATDDDDYDNDNNNDSKRQYGHGYGNGNGVISQPLYPISPRLSGSRSRAALAMLFGLGATPARATTTSSSVVTSMITSDDNDGINGNGNDGGDEASDDDAIVDYFDEEEEQNEAEQQERLRQNAENAAAAAAAAAAAEQRQRESALAAATAAATSESSHIDAAMAAAAGLTLPLSSGTTMNNSNMSVLPSTNPTGGNNASLMATSMMPSSSSGAPTDMTTAMMSGYPAAPGYANNMRPYDPRRYIVPPMLPSLLCHDVIGFM
jgi:hypothetical protein